ncbi:MAG TPA: sigma-70 family RNA polymerase sigma factor [Kofleriaceae bacterium]|jgi:RNA polymerase sigma factor (sigma-70 family)|nr:sigma-70 family RNA polymerase sigma factor [Kofleriaceae bacterium]
MGRITASDAELVDASRKGDRAAFGEVIARYQRTVFAVGYSATNDRALGEDVAQDTFVAAFHQLDQLREVSRLREWLCGIARNLARQARRIRAREDEIDDAQPDPAATPFDAATERERDSVVAAALASMPETYREPLVMYYVEQRSAPVVAAALGITTDAVHQRLSRGRQLMATEVVDLVERTLQQRRSRRNLVAAVLAALPLAVIPARANATNATGGSSMSKLGIAAALAAVLGGAGYAVHRVYAAPRDASVHSASPSGAASSSPLFSVHAARQARRFAATSAPPALPPATTSASSTASAANTCATVAAHMTSFVSSYAGSAVPIAMTGAELRAAMAGSGDSHTHVFFVAGSNATADAVTGMTDVEQQCLDQDWSQGMIDCLSSLGSDQSCTAYYDSSESSNLAVAGPTEAQLAAVTDASCAAVGSHLLSLATAALPADGSDTVMGGVVAALNAQLAAQNPIATVCESTGWSESQRRCLAAVSESDQALACR